MFVYVCVCLCMFVCVRVRVRRRVRVRYVCMCVSVYVCVLVCACLCLSVCVCASVSVCLCVSVYLGDCVFHAVQFQDASICYYTRANAVQFQLMKNVMALVYGHASSPPLISHHRLPPYLLQVHGPLPLARLLWLPLFTHARFYAPC